MGLARAAELDGQHARSWSLNYELRLLGSGSDVDGRRTSHAASSSPIPLSVTMMMSPERDFSVVRQVLVVYAIDNGPSFVISRNQQGS